jgi:internalin A
MHEIQREFDRLDDIYSRIGRVLHRSAPASDQEISSIVSETGISVDDSLKALWKLSNGSTTMWFAEGERDFTPYYFLSIAEALEFWRMQEQHEWLDDEEEWGERDERIQKHVFSHRSWMPFAVFNGGSHMLYFDDAPTDEGARGQIINFIHDPDLMYWSSASFLDFFRASNNTLEEWTVDPEALRDKLYLWD